MNTDAAEVRYCGCGVPLHLHNTCCGWSNANLIVTPSNDQEREWQRLKEEASGMKVFPDGTFAYGYPIS